MAKYDTHKNLQSFINKNMLFIFSSVHLQCRYTLTNTMVYVNFMVMACAVLKCAEWQVHFKGWIEPPSAAQCALAISSYGFAVCCYDCFSCSCIYLCSSIAGKCRKFCHTWSPMWLRYVLSLCQSFFQWRSLAINDSIYNVWRHN